MSLILLGLLLFFELTLLEALADGTAHGVEDHSDRLGRIVICRDNVINVGWIHNKYLPLQIREYSIAWPPSRRWTPSARPRRTERPADGQVGDRTEVLLEFRTLTARSAASHAWRNYRTCRRWSFLSMVDIFLTALRMVGKFVSIPPAQRSVT